MPDLHGHPGRQIYRTVAVTESGAFVNDTDVHRSADIVANGLLVEYFEVATRL
jgi:hypothetical protein